MKSKIASVFLLATTILVNSFALPIQTDTDVILKLYENNFSSLRSPGLIRIIRNDKLDEIYDRETKHSTLINGNKITTTTLEFYDISDSEVTNIFSIVRNKEDIYVFQEIPEADGYQTGMIIKKYKNGIKVNEINLRLQDRRRWALHPSFSKDTKNLFFVMALATASNITPVEFEYRLIKFEPGGDILSDLGIIDTTSGSRFLSPFFNDKYGNFYMVKNMVGYLTIRKFNENNQTIYVKNISTETVGKNLAFTGKHQVNSNGDLILETAEVVATNFDWTWVDTTRIMRFNSVGDKIAEISSPSKSLYHRAFRLVFEKDRQYIFSNYMPLPLRTEEIHIYNSNNILEKKIMLPLKRGYPTGANSFIQTFQESYYDEDTSSIIEFSILPDGYIYFFKTNILNPIIALYYTGNENFDDTTIQPKYLSKSEEVLNFEVKYKNQKGISPIANFPKLNIFENGTHVSGSPFTMQASTEGIEEIDYSMGIVYKYTYSLSVNSGSLYTYSFAVSDGTDYFESDLYRLSIQPPNGNKAYNYPNPFNPKRENTNILFNAVKNESVKIKIFSLNGKLVFEDTFNALAGANEYVYSGKDNNGKELYNGIYICLIEKSGGISKCKIAIVK